MSNTFFRNLVHGSFVRHVEHHRVIDSTNNRARRLALGEDSLSDPCEPCPKSVRDCLPCLILADEQSAGRGRGANRWWTGPGSLAMSLLLPPLADWPQLFQYPPASLFKASSVAPSEKASICPGRIDAIGVRSPASGGTFPPHPAWPLAKPASPTVGRGKSFQAAEKVPENHQPNRLPIDRQIPPTLLGLTAALAVVHTVQTRLPAIEVGLHWPNDVFAAGKKLAGILTELVGPGWVIVGIGVNTNNTAHQAPEELRPRLTTLRDLTGQIHPHEQLLPELLSCLEEVFSLLVYLPDQVAADAHQWCLQRGQTLKVHTPGGDVDGICEGIGPQGELLLKTPAGLQRIFSGSIVG